MSKVVEITVDLKGGATVRTRGFIGPECREAGRLGLAGLGPALLQAPDGLERLVDGRRRQLVLDRPLEQPDDPADPLVDRRARQPGVDHRLADALHRQRPEFAGGGAPVESPQGPERIPIVVQLAGGRQGRGVLAGRGGSESRSLSSSPVGVPSG